MSISQIRLFLTRIKQNKLIDQFFKFWGVCIISCTINLGSRFLINFIFSFVESVFLSSILGGIANFGLMKYYVFHSKKNFKKELFLYGILAVLGIFLITALSAGFERIFMNYNIFIISKNITYFIIQLISLGINSLVGFFLCKYVIFTEVSCKHKTD
jgi:hypothetical protein